MKKQSNAEENIERYNAPLDKGLTSEQVDITRQPNKRQKLILK